MSACGAFTLTLPALVALIVLFFWTISTSNNNNNNDGNNNGGEYRPWWELDFRQEEVESAKILVNVLYLIIACATLFVPIIKAGSGVYERFNVGVLAASMFMFGNMLFVSFWYLLNLGGREEEQNNNNNNNNGYNGYNNYNAYWAMDERELLAYHQKVISYVVVALALLFFLVSAGIHGTGEMLPQTSFLVHNNSAQVTAAAQFEAMSGHWMFLSLCNIVVFVGLFLAAIMLLLSGEDVDRMIEDARLINLIMVLLSLGITSIVMLIWGNSIFSDKRWGSLGVGMLYGGTKYFGALCFMVCILFANLTFDEREREEGLWVSTATAVACFFLSFVHLAFAMRARRYQVTIFDAHSEQAATLNPQTGMVYGGDYAAA